MNPKCQNFAKCKNYTNSPHTKWCKDCSIKWQGQSSGAYKFKDKIVEEDCTGFVFVRKDLMEDKK